MASPLVRGLLRSYLVLRLAAIPVLLLTLLSGSFSAQPSQVPYRHEIIRLLQQLVTTGYPLDNEHDDGEWLQAAVNYAIHMRDQEIEQLAIRAAVPLRARITRPITSTDAPASIEVLSYRVLELRRPVSYVARIESSLDGSPFMEVGSHDSIGPNHSFGGTISIDLRRLGAAALRPGSHHVRLRARMVFGDPHQPVYSEVRELPPIAYALYDEHRGQRADARQFIYSPAAFKASDFDPLLPSQPLLQWLNTVLASRAELADPRMWTSRYCSELTDEHLAAHDAGGLCTVIYFSGGWLGQLWFRTGHVETSDSGATWHLAERPSIETLLISNGRVGTRLSALPALLEPPYETEQPRDRTVSAPEIVMTPAAPKRGAPAKAVITLHNSGELSIQNLKLEIVHLDGPADGGMRHFVIDIPPLSSKSVSLDVTFRSGYGLIVALPFIKDHGLVHDVMGPPLDSPCAVRVVNAAAAPRDYLRANMGHLTDCVSR